MARDSENRRSRLERDRRRVEQFNEEEDYEEYARRQDALRGKDPSQRPPISGARSYSEPVGLNGASSKPASVPARNVRKRKKKHPIRNFFLFLLLILILAVGGGVAYLRSKLQTVNSVDLEETLQGSIAPEVRSNSAMNGYTNIALFGVDSREQDLLGGNNRSDSIMVASFNNKTGDIKLVSIYRDTYLDLGGGTYQKCNAAYAYGGPQQAVAMLNANLDLNITDFVTVGFEGLADTIDALGGIDLEITDEEAGYMNSYMDDMSYEIGTPYDEVDGGGMKHLSGIQATAYCRIRYTAGDDFKRAERQRTVLALTMQKARSAGPLQLISVANSVMDKTATSLTTMELLKLIIRSRNLNISEQGGFPTEEDRIFATIDGASCVVPYYLNTNVKWLHGFLFGEEDYVPSVTVQGKNDYINSMVQ